MSTKSVLRGGRIGDTLKTRMAKIYLKIQIFALVIFSFMVSISHAQDAPLLLDHDGKIRFFAYHLDDFKEIQYLNEKGQWIEEAYDEINTLLRSRGDDDTIIMNKNLIELADHLQDHFAVDTVEIISAFRSQSFNKSLKDAGRNVANESFHTKGMAMDIHLDEIKEATIRDYLLEQKLGGVGYYGNILMVHMDFGPVRQWQGGEYLENTEIGIFNKVSLCKIKTNQLFYVGNQELLLTLDCDEATGKLELEKFIRGRWVKQGSVQNVNRSKISISELQKLVHETSAFGKFRLKYTAGDDWQNSNEFYIKRL